MHAVHFKNDYGDSDIYYMQSEPKARRMFSSVSSIWKRANTKSTTHLHVAYYLHCPYNKYKYRIIITCREMKPNLCSAKCLFSLRVSLSVSQRLFNSRVYLQATVHRKNDIRSWNNKSWFIHPWMRENIFNIHFLVFFFVFSICVCVCVSVFYVFNRKIHFPC